MIRHHNHRRLALETMETRICLDGAAYADNVVDQDFAGRETDDRFAIIREQTVDPYHFESVETGGAESVGARVGLAKDPVDAAATVEFDLVVVPPPPSAGILDNLEWIRLHPQDYPDYDTTPS